MPASVALQAMAERLAVRESIKSANQSLLGKQREAAGWPRYAVSGVLTFLVSFVF